MRRAIPPLPQYVFMAWCLIKHAMGHVLSKHRDKFTLLYLLLCHVVWWLDTNVSEDRAASFRVEVLSVE